ncbi:hypothetical protein B0T09DRAFT_317136 [Sordaria sp. MPI-SDFR-AT-0083]|nr:hypothetical protein B0T09DRAFT_317136 [Sordaria sp. MPI-SDFR-AT-0083]
MADPLSIAGLITGVVSLGIQLHNDLETFIDVVRHRDEDVAKLARHAATMAQALNTIERCIAPGTVRLITGSRVPHKGIKRPEGLKCGGIRKATTQKLKYPRQRANIQKLEEGLDQANKTLQLALKTFGL